MKVRVTLNKTNTGKIQVACVRSANKYRGMGTGYALAPFDAKCNKRNPEPAIEKAMELLAEVGPRELVTVANHLEVPSDVLRANGFLSVA